MTSQRIGVVKVGGSLFSRADMPVRVHAWLERRPAGVTVFIGGGGDLIEPLRTAHTRFGLNEESSHWLAIRAMTVTSRLLAELLGIELVERFQVLEQIIAAKREAVCVLDVEEFLRRTEPESAGCRLPRTWSCTSDSIAARVAEVLRADELVLLKSLTYPPDTTLAAAAAQGLVDPHFPHAAAGLRRVSWINLVSADLHEQLVVVPRR